MISQPVERYWAPCGVDAEAEVCCRMQGERKVIDGKMSINWFDDNNSVSGDTYLQGLAFLNQKFVDRGKLTPTI